MSLLLKLFINQHVFVMLLKKARKKKEKKKKKKKERKKEKKRKKKKKKKLQHNFYEFYQCGLGSVGPLADSQSDHIVPHLHSYRTCL